MSVNSKHLSFINITSFRRVSKQASSYIHYYTMTVQFNKIGCIVLCKLQENGTTCSVDNLWNFAVHSLKALHEALAYLYTRTCTNHNLVIS